MKPYYPNFGQQKELIPGSYICTDRVPIYNAPTLLVMESTFGKKNWCVIDGDRYTCFMALRSALNYYENRRKLSYSKPSAINPRTMK